MSVALATSPQQLLGGKPVTSPALSPSSGRMSEAELGELPVSVVVCVNNTCVITLLFLTAKLGETKDSEWESLLH